MKNRIKISVLCICILLAASGCGTGVESEASFDESTELAAVTESDQEGQTESDDYYEETAADTEESTAGNDAEKSAEESEDYDSSSDMPVSEPDTDIEDEAPSDDNLEPDALTESNREEQTEPCDYYEELIAAARECIEGRVEEEPEDYYDFSYIIYQYGPYHGASLGLGYLIEDIDGNGTNELIFGENDELDSAWNGVIYDLYTISDGELVHVFSGGERDRYYFCENGMIANEGSDGASVSGFVYYIFEGAELHLVEAVVYNGWEDSDNPWFYSTQTDSYYDMENLETISDEQAQAVMEKYIYERLTLIPFVEE
ncbi:MAG: hypothetical protein K2H45_01800 [Acetatifactor sp.]|nr:hypothetical protein [Acetatifactor sp.]